MQFKEGRNARFLLLGTVALVVTCAFVLDGLGPAARGSSRAEIFEVKKGEGFMAIAAGLTRKGLVRRPAAFFLWASVAGSAKHLKPGIYTLSPSMSGFDILNILVQGQVREVVVTIPEGSTLYDIDRILSAAGVLSPESLIAFLESSPEPLEGKLFPDTYRLFTNISPEEVVEKLTRNFEVKAEPLFQGERDQLEENLIMASLLEREIPDLEERRVVAGVLRKRLQAGMPLQVDATICYVKEQRARGEDGSCYPLTPLDFTVDSPYNSYRYKGLPPAPIGNPGTSSIFAALHPKPSPYWFYLSDPATGKTVFSKTLDEQEANRVKYLRR